MPADKHKTYLNSYRKLRYREYHNYPLTVIPKSGEIFPIQDIQKEIRVVMGLQPELALAGVVPAKILKEQMQLPNTAAGLNIN